MIKVKVNGKLWEASPRSSIADLLAKIKISPAVCVVEKNGAIVEKKLYNHEMIEAGDEIEIIRMMGGG